MSKTEINLRSSQQRQCQICGKKGSAKELFPAALVRSELAEQIKQSYPDWSKEGFICHEDLNQFRSKYVSSLVETERGELSALELEVVDSLAKQEILSSHLQETFESQTTFGQRMSDHIATFGGSWRFIIIFGVTMFLWIAMNSIVLIKKPFDPFPFILLNLVLSCLAAIQAPIIMMSQNRQEVKDRLRSVYDYQINLKAELEIRQLHQKIDHLLLHQWERLVEIQDIQMDIMDEIRTNSQKKSNNKKIK
jgi:uncharacterized membrane protein